MDWGTVRVADPGRIEVCAYHHHFHFHHFNYLRSGGIIAATWASLMNHGWDGYTEMTRSIVRAADTVRAAIDKIDGISVLGDSKLCILAFTSERFHVYKVADEMKVRTMINSKICAYFIASETWVDAVLYPEP